MAEFMTFGEIMLRLKSPQHERFFQSPNLEATFGGGESNVAVSLANFGLNSGFVTALPNGDIAQACLRALKGLDVDTSHIARCGDRLGIYFLEAGSNQRPSKVIYDREHSSIAVCDPDAFDWAEILAGCCPSSNKWNRRNDYLMESFAHHFHITRRVVGSANDVSRWSFS